MTTTTSNANTTSTSTTATSTESLFVDYEPTTTDPGLSLTLCVLVFSLFVNCCIPIWIKLYRILFSSGGGNERQRGVGVGERNDNHDNDNNNKDVPQSLKVDDVIVVDTWNTNTTTNTTTATTTATIQTTTTSPTQSQGTTTAASMASKEHPQQHQVQHQEEEGQHAAIETMLSWMSFDYASSAVAVGSTAADGDCGVGGGTSTSRKDSSPPKTPSPPAAGAGTGAGGADNNDNNQNGVDDAPSSSDNDLSNFFDTMLDRLSPMSYLHVANASVNSATATTTFTDPPPTTVVTMATKRNEPTDDTDNNNNIITNCDTHHSSSTDDDDDDISLASMASSIASSIVSGVLLDGPRPTSRYKNTYVRRNNKNKKKNMTKRDVAGYQRQRDETASSLSQQHPSSSSSSAAAALAAGSKLVLATTTATTNVNNNDVNDNQDNGTNGSKFLQRLDEILDITSFDKEMWRILKLVIPFVATGIIEGLYHLFYVSIIGYWLGVRSANAYVVVTIFTELSDTISYGYYEALGNLGPQAEGANNKKLVGQYFQISTVLNFVTSIPMILVWAYLAEPATLWLGFDEETGQLARQYALPYTTLQVVMAFDDVMDEFLNFTDHEYYNLVSNAWYYIQDGLTLMFVVGYLEFTSLQSIGYAQILMSTIFVVGNYSLVIFYMGWFDEYWEGYAKSFAFKNKRAVKNLIVTAIPLSLSWVLTYGEWEIMTLIVSFMGPAEVAAWGLLGFLWSLFEQITDAVADAAEVRVGHHMGSGRHAKARRAGYKAVYIGFVISVFTTSLVYIFGKNIVTLVTPDVTLQRMIYDMLPLVGYSQVGFVVSTVCWAILGAQGRYSLATRITYVGSWILTLPWTALTVVALNWNLIGPTSALVIGYSCSGAAMIACFVTSDWKSLSDDVIALNEGSVSSDSSDDSSDDSSAADGAGIYDSYDWNELPNDVKAAAKALGYTKKIWDGDESVPGLSDVDWDALSADKKKAAQTLGYTQATWDGSTHPTAPPTNDNGPAIATSSSSDDGRGNKYEDYDWDDLPKKAKVAAQALGYDGGLWDSDGAVPSASLAWGELTDGQRAAAMVLGYDKSGWDDDSSSSSSSSSTEVSSSLASCTHAAQSSAPPVSSSNNDYGSVPSYEDCDWDELPTKIQIAVQALGYTEKIWDEGGKAACEDKAWDELTRSERNAAETLGYNEKIWNR